MEKQKVLKIFSVFMILVCLFSFVAGGLGIRDVFNQKDIELDKLDAATEQVDTLEAGVKKLEAKRADYNAGKKKVAQGEIDYAAGVKKLADGQATYDAGVKTLAAKQKEYDAGLAQYNAGLKELNANTATYKAGKAALPAAAKQLAEGKAQIDAYEKGQADLTAATPAYTAGKEQLAANKTLYETYKPQYDALVAAGSTDWTKEPYKTMKAKVLEYEAGLAQVKQYDDSKAYLDSQTAAYEQGKKDYAAGLAQYNAGVAKVAAYEAAQAKLTAAKKQLDAGKKALAAGQAQLDAAKVQLTEGQAALDAAAAQLADGKKQLAEFEAGQKQVNAGYVKLEKNADIKAKVEDGMTPVAAAREVLDEETQEVKDDLAARLYTNIAILAVALIILVAAILTFMNKKINLAFVLSIIALLAAIGTNIYGGTNDYSEYKLQMVAAIVEGVFALVYTGLIFSYKRNATPNN